MGKLLDVIDAKAVKQVGLGWVGCSLVRIYVSNDFFPLSEPSFLNHNVEA